MRDKQCELTSSFVKCKFSIYNSTSLYKLAVNNNVVLNFIFKRFRLYLMTVSILASMIIYINNFTHRFFIKTAMVMSKKSKKLLLMINILF